MTSKPPVREVYIFGLSRAQCVGFKMEGRATYTRTVVNLRLKLIQINQRLITIYYD